MNGLFVKQIRTILFICESQVIVCGWEFKNKQFERGKTKEPRRRRKKPEMGEIKAEKEKESDVITNYGIGIRHVQMVCMFICVVAMYVGRSCMSVAVLAMTDQGRRNDTDIVIYSWDKKTQGLILSSFFWGYTVMQIPGGILAKKFGGKPVVLFGLLANGVLSLALPLLAQWGDWPMVCAARVAMGLTQACLFPSTHTVIGRWIPMHERASITGFVYGGVQLGVILSMPLCGVLASTAMGWKLIYYAISGIMFAAALIWFALSASTPGAHHMISAEEREYIESGMNLSKKEGTLRTPWLHILRTKELWACLVAHVAGTIGFTMFFIDMPTYLEHGLQISLKNSAVLSALPFIGMWIGGVASSWISEALSNRKLLSVITCRKIFNSISLFGSAASLIVLSFVGPDSRNLAIVILFIALMMFGSGIAGHMVNLLDLSPNFAGVLLSMTNTASNLGSVVTPIATSFILNNDPTDVTRWRIAFLIVAAISVIFNCAYLVFAGSERKDWDDPNYLDKTKADREDIKFVLIKPYVENATNS